MRYRLIDFSIKNQRFFNSIAIIIFISGIFVYINTQKDLFPEIKDAFINVQVIYPGASAETINQHITNPIENKISALVEIKQSSSVARKNIGITQFIVDRKYYENLNEIRQLVQNVLDTIKFPDQAFKPKISTFTLNNAPIMSLHFQGDDRVELYEVTQDFEIELQYIDMLEAPVIRGQEEYQYKIEVDPKVITRRGMSIGEIYNSIQQSKANIPSGNILKDGTINVLSVVSPMNDVSTIENIVIRANEQGQVILLKDVAKVKFEYVSPESFYSLNGKDGIIFDISKSQFADILKIKKEVSKLVEKYQASYPNINISFFNDSSLRIGSRLKLLTSNLTIGLVLVFIMLILFLNFSTALWTTAGVPISFCIGLIVSVLLMGININTISMIGFLIILGVVVDDGIVFSENAYRHFEMGKQPRQAVIQGMGEVAPSIVFASLTTIASIITISQLDGKIGDFSKPLPIVIIATLLGSLFETLFILPGHLEHSFKHHKISTKVTIKSRVFSFLQVRYEKMLGVLVHHRKKSFFSIVAIIVVLTSLMLTQIPFVFFSGPLKDISIFFETHVGSPIDETKKSTDQIARFLYKNTAFTNVYSVSGLNGESHKSYIRGDIDLSVSPDYDWLSFKLRLQEFIKLNVTNITNYRFNPIGEDSFYMDRLDIIVKGTNFIEVKKLAGEIKDYLKTQPNIDNPRLNISPKTFSQDIIVDTKQAKMYGITPREIAQNISMAYEGIVAGTVISNGVSYDLKLQYNDTNYSSLTNMKIPNQYNQFIGLKEMATFIPTMIETDIYTEDGLFAVKIQDSLYKTSVLENNSFSILSDVQKKFAQYQDNLGAALYFDNEKEEVTRGVTEITIAVVIGVVLVFLILLYMFNSFISTLLAIIGIPFIFFGLTTGLFFMNLPLNNMALVGILALLGLVVNDSIVLLEFLYHNIKDEDHFESSLVKNVGIRFRPIFMTTLTTLVGVAPIAFGFAGNEFLLQPLAVVTFFGVLSVSLITLILLPLIISILELDMHGFFLKPTRAITNIFKRLSIKRKKVPKCKK